MGVVDYVMRIFIRKQPLEFTLGVTVAIITLAVGGRLVLKPLFPSLTLDGIGLVLNWILVALTLALVAWLGWWDEIRLTRRVNRRGLVYLLPLGAMVVLPAVFGLSIPEVSLFEGGLLPPWANLLVIVLGVALGAAVFDEILYRGVLLRALEPRGKLFAGVITAMAFGLTHVLKIILGGSIVEWLPSMLIIIPLGIGLAAVAFRLESIWPLIVWHLAYDVTSLLAASQSAAYVLSLLALIIAVGVMGVWLLWQDHKAARNDTRATHEREVVDL